jgi:hypothetical protein
LQKNRRARSVREQKWSFPAVNSRRRKQDKRTQSAVSKDSKKKPLRMKDENFIDKSLRSFDARPDAVLNI